MADKKISELAVASTPLAGTELIEIVQGGVNKQTTASQFGGTVPDASESTKGIAELAEQSEVNTGTDDNRIVTPKKLAEVDHAAVALTDGGSIALTAPKHTLTTDEATVTFSYTFTGEEMKVLITLNALSATYTFPSGTLCITSEGTPTGDNIMAVSGASGDKYLLVVTKFGSSYVAIIKNIGQ